MPQAQPFDPASWLESRAFRWSLAAAYVLVPVWVMYVLLGRPVAGADDANIFFVYARNFAHGHGIVYSVGGPHVEGYSSVLYFLLCAICYVFTSHPETLLLLLNAVFAVATMGLLFSALTAAAKRSGVELPGRFAMLCALALWVCINPCFYAWDVVLLMDNGLYSLVLVAAFSLLARRALNETIQRETLQASVIAVLLVLARPEGMLWGIAFLVAYAWLAREDGESLTALSRKCAAPAASFVAVMLALLVFRLAYFGVPLPNTYYAKVSDAGATWHDGWQYFWNFATHYGAAAIIVLLALAALLYGVLFLRKQQGASPLARFAILAAATAALGLLMPVLDGGDHFNAFRMYQPVYPLLGVCAMTPLLLFPWLREWPRAIGGLVIAGFLIAISDTATWTAFAAYSPSLNVGPEIYIARTERVNGERLSTMFSGELPIIGYGSSGGIAYGYQGRVYDMMGLNDARMARADKIKSGPKGHQSFNKTIFYEIEPDILMSQTATASETVSLPNVAAYYNNPAGWDNMIFKGIFNDPEFRSKYVLALATETAQPGYKCFGFFNRAYLQRLRTEGKYQIEVLEL